MVKGEGFEDEIVDVRVHKQRPLVDVFSDHLTGGRSREFGLKMLQQSERGVYVYLTNEDTASSVVADAAEFDNAPKNPEAPKKMDPRLYGVGAQILRQLGVRR